MYIAQTLQIGQRQTKSHHRNQEILFVQKLSEKILFSYKKLKYILAKGRGGGKYGLASSKIKNKEQFLVLTQNRKLTLVYNNKGNNNNSITSTTTTTTIINNNNNNNNNIILTSVQAEERRFPMTEQMLKVKKQVTGE